MAKSLVGADLMLSRRELIKKLPFKPLLLEGRRRIQNLRDSIEPAVLSVEQLKSYAENGYLLIPNFIQQSNMSSLNRALDLAWERRCNAPDSVVIEYNIHSPQEVCTNFHKAPSEARTPSYVIYRLDHFSSRFRSISNNTKLRRMARQILGNSADFMGSTVFEWGTETPAHFDFIYSPKPGSRKLMVGWLALEDVDPDAGPVELWSGSHKIVEQMILSCGRPNNQKEAKQLLERVRTELNPDRKMDQKFICKAGDLILWNELVIHAGTAIKNRDKTRRSILSTWYSEWK